MANRADYPNCSDFYFNAIEAHNAALARHDKVCARFQAGELSVAEWKTSVEAKRHADDAFDIAWFVEMGRREALETYREHRVVVDDRQGRLM